MKTINKAIEIQPDYVNAYNNRGVVYAKKGDYNRAIEDYDKAIEIQPDDAQCLLQSVVAPFYGTKGEMEKAKADLITAKEMGNLISLLHIVTTMKVLRF